MVTSGRSLATVVLVLLIAGLVPRVSLAESVEELTAQRTRLQARLDAAARELVDVETRVAALEERRDELERRMAEREHELAEIDARIVERVRQVYMHGTSLEPVAVFLASDDPGDALDRAGTVQRLVRGDRADAEDVAAVRLRLRAGAARLEEREDELAGVLAAQRELTSRLSQDLARARELEQRLRQRERERERQSARRRAERARRSATAAAPVGGDAATGSSGMVCPVDQPRSFTDTWGASRSGGRRHRGTDILAPRGTPIRAITGGVWDIQPPGASAGLWAILRGDDGEQYWYLHLERHTVADGARVSAGQQTGTNGDTGNARGTPHLHFELHPGGGSAVNPYSLLRRVC